MPFCAPNFARAYCSESESEEVEGVGGLALVEMVGGGWGEGLWDGGEGSRRGGYGERLTFLHGFAGAHGAESHLFGRGGRCFGAADLAEAEPAHSHA